jgi:hypothetical protein
MTLGTNILLDRCDLCGTVLEEGVKDIHELSKPYELPYKIEWEGTNCIITDKVVKHICSSCLTRIMGVVGNCME